ncbi:MAG: sensor histidine kinase [Elusimicrobiota bacterium]|nr:sensor histidine kinase [Elusimicrobiota bacterium]
MRAAPWLLRGANLASFLFGAWLFARGRAVTVNAPAFAALILASLQGVLVFAGKPDDAKTRRLVESGAAVLDLLFIVWAVHWIGAWRAGLEIAAVAPAVLLALEAGPWAGAAAAALPVAATVVLGAVVGGRPAGAYDAWAAALNALPAAAAALSGRARGGPGQRRNTLARLRAAQFGEYLSFAQFQLRDYVITMTSVTEALALSGPKEDPKFVERLERLRRTEQELSAKLARLLGDKSALTSYRASQAPVDLAALARSAAEEARAAFAPDIPVEVVVEAALPPARSDRKVVELSLLAVLQNSLEACHAKGGGRVTVLLRPRDGQAEIEVTDDGGGVHESVLPTVFEPIVSARPGGHGMGLGLSMTRRLLERIGGGVRLKSKGGFTAVLLLIPLDKELPQIRLEESTWAGRRAGA